MLMEDKIETDALKTRSYSTLVEWGESYNRPAATIRNPFDSMITCFEFHEKRQVFLLGFDSGEVRLHLAIWEMAFLRII